MDKKPAAMVWGRKLNEEATQAYKDSPSLFYSHGSSTTTVEKKKIKKSRREKEG